MYTSSSSSFSPMLSTGFPNGYRFEPEPWKLIDYIEKKNSELPLDIPIPEYDVYDKFPRGFPDDYKSKKGTKKYVFAQLKRMCKRGSMWNRSTSAGTWREHSKEDIEDEGNLIGFKKTFYFRGKDKINNKWAMHEFSLKEAKEGNFVLCEIYEKAKVAETKNTSTWEANEEVRRQQSPPSYPHESNSVFDQFEFMSSQETSMSWFPDNGTLDAAPARPMVMEPYPHQSNFMFGPEISENGTPLPFFTDNRTLEYDNGGLMNPPYSNHMNYLRQFGIFDTTNSPNIGDLEFMVMEPTPNPLPPMAATYDQSFDSTIPVSTQQSLPEFSNIFMSDILWD